MSEPVQKRVDDAVEAPELVTPGAAAAIPAPAAHPAVSGEVDEDGDPISTLPPDMLKAILAQLGAANISGAAGAPAGAVGAVPSDGLAAIAAGLGGRFPDDDSADAGDASTAAGVAAEPVRVNDGKDGLWRNTGPVPAHPTTKLNTKRVVCANCKKSTILLPGAAAHITKEAFLAYPLAKSNDDGENYSDFFQVNGKMTFENIGVRQPAGQCEYRYLTCADCEWGPLGVTFNADANRIFYVAHARVMYK
jgi:hypothetical protein